MPDRLPKRLNPFKDEHEQVLKRGIQAVTDASRVMAKMKELGIPCDENEGLCQQFQEMFDAIRSEFFADEFSLIDV